VTSRFWSTPLQFFHNTQSHARTHKYTRTHTHAHAHMHKHMHTQTYTQTYTHAHTHIHQHPHTRTHAHTLTHTHTYTHTHTCTHMHTHTLSLSHTHTHIHARIQIHTHTQRSSLKVIGPYLGVFTQLTHLSIAHSVADRHSVYLLPLPPQLSLVLPFFLYASSYALAHALALVLTRSCD